MMDTITKLKSIYAGGGEVGRIDDTSDWSYFLILDPPFLGLAYFYFSFLEGDLEGDLEPSFSLSLLLDFPDLTDLF